MVQAVSGVRNVDIEIQLRHQKFKHQNEKSKSANHIQSENFFINSCVTLTNLVIFLLLMRKGVESHFETIV